VRRCLGLLLLGAAAPASAGTYSWGGQLDAGYSRSDVRADGLSSASPAWDFGAQLSLNLVPLRPDIVQLSGSGSYRQSGSESSATTFDTSTRAKSWGYAVSASALQFLPLTFSGFASRTEADFATSVSQTQIPGSAQAPLTGVTTVTTRGANAAFHVDRIPSLTAQLNQSEFDNTGIGGLRSTGKSTFLTLSGSHYLENHEYSVGYGTGWNEGSLVDTNYRTHQATLRGLSRLTSDVDVTLNQNYLLRKPEAGFATATNPRFDDNLTNADVRWRLGRDVSGSGGYAYHRSVVDSPDPLSSLEQLNHVFNAGASWNRSRQLSLSASLGGAFGQDRTSAGTRSHSGESVSLGARWDETRGETRWSAGGNLSAGLSQSGGKEYYGYGVGATAGLSGFFAGWSAAFGYDGSFSSNLGGQIGFTLRNALTGSADTRSAGGVRYRAQLQISDSRQHQQSVGGSSAQTISASASAGWSVHYLDFTAGLTNAAAAAVGGPSEGLGVFSSKLNTLSRFAGLSGSTVLLPDLTLSGFVRYAAVSAPERPDTWETALNARLGYNLGLFTVSIEDRYAVGAQGGSSSRTNVVLVRVSRSFGGSL